MNNKLLLALGILGTVSLSGCTVLENMFKADSVDNTNAEYIGKASESLDIAVENLELLENTVIPSMSGTTYQLKDKDNNTYKCTIATSLFGGDKPAICKKKVGNKWEKYGDQHENDEDAGDSWFTFTFGGGADEYGKNPYQKDQDRLAGKSTRSTKASKNAGTPQVIANNVVANEVVPSRASADKPTIVFTPEDDKVSFRTNPTKTYNGRFKVRDEQGHSYECHFANVGQIVSDTISVCTKLY